jgi:hypothetical protein
VPQTAKRRLATVAAPLLPAAAGRAVRRRLMSGGMYADEATVEALTHDLFQVESMDRFTSEAHLHVRVVLCKRS